ncbi:MAG: transcriptional activator RfaH [Verrucomicrobiota bacterium]
MQSLVTSSEDRPTTPLKAGAQWFCIRTKPKHEHIAAAHIRKYQGTEVFFPRIRLERASRGGKIRVLAPLFPTYLFARFDLMMELRSVRYASGVLNVVHFGHYIPIIPDQVIENLRLELDSEGVCEGAPEFVPGDAVEVITGAFRGFQGQVLRTMTSGQRVAILLDFLGRQVMVEIEAEFILKEAADTLAGKPSNSGGKTS